VNDPAVGCDDAMVVCDAFTAAQVDAAAAAEAAAAAAAEAAAAAAAAEAAEAEAEAEALPSYSHVSTNVYRRLPPEDIFTARYASAARAHTRPLVSSTSAVLVTPPGVPLSNRLGGNHAAKVSHKICLH
jgi:regulator of protease activity HflC (stomatin/prohibitin superfamily)